MNSISLKFGTLKNQSLDTEEAIRLSDALDECDPEDEQGILLSLIDHCDEIYLWWEEKYVTKEEAKAYVLNYKNPKQ